VKPCPYCAEAIQDDTRVCPHCSTNLAAPTATSVPQPPPMTGEAQTSGKAIASLICGVFFFVLPSAIVAVIMGHLSLSDIRRSAGRLGGRGLAITGLVFGYAGLSFIPVLIIAAIAIPNLIRAKIAANEASAVGSVRLTNMACVRYLTQYNSFPQTLADLGPSTQPSARGANLIGAALASGQKTGYGFTYEPGPEENGMVRTYTLHADPINPGTTGFRHFFADQTAVIRLSRDGPADENSPPIM
jgi:type IV pilus assembly protein PilA